MTDPLEDSFAQILADFDEQLRSGRTITHEARTLPSAAWQERLSAAQEFLRVVAAVWPRSAPADLGPLHALPRRIGRFEVQRILGSGGAGIVYLARDPLLGRDVAVKVPRLEMVLTPALRQRFLREARAAALLNHPRIIPTLEVGEAGDLCFIVYAYCPGPTLAQWLSQAASPVPCTSAASLVEQLADTMAHAHQRGVLHRDLKPGNILLNGAEPHITDFGLAKLAADADEVTRTGAVLGTPAYMAPEQTRGVKDLGPACDLWALGVILYELLTGRRPFEGATPLETMRQIQEVDPVAPRRHRRDVPRDLETICLRCLAKDSRARYASAYDLAADLRRFQEGRPVCARPTSWLETTWKWSRRHPAAAALVAVVFVALAVGSLGVLSYIERLEDLVAAADRERDAKKRETILQERASIEQKRARHLQYVGDIRSTVESIKARNYDTARLMLKRWPDSSGADERGIEWYELTRQLAQTRPLRYVLPKGEVPTGMTLAAFATSSHAFALSPDGRFAASMRSGAIDIYETATWKKVKELPPLPAQHCFCQGLAFSTDGSLLAAGYHRTFADGSLHPSVVLWDWRRAAALKSMDYNEQPALATPMDLAFAAKGDLLVVRVDESLFLHSVSDFPKVAQTHAMGPINRAVLSADGTLLGLGRPGEQKLELREFPSLKLRHALDWPMKPGPKHLCFSRDGKRVLFGSGRFLYLATTQNSTPDRLSEWEADIRAVALSNNGEWLHVACERGQVDIIDANHKRTAFYEKTDQLITHLAPDPDGRRLYMRNQSGGVRLVDANWPSDPASISVHKSRLYAVAFSPDGSLLASGGQQPGVHIHDVATGSEIIRLDCTSEIFSLAFDRDGKTLAAGGIDGRIHRWQVQRWKALPAYVGHTGRVAGLAFTPDGGRLLSMGWDKTCRLWDLATGSIVHVFHGPYDYFSGLALAPDGAEFAWLGDNDNNLRLWNLTDRSERAFPFSPVPRGVAYSPDGRWLATSTGMGDIYWWDARAGRLLHRIQSHERGVRALLFSPDGKTLATAGLDKIVKIWDTASFLELATLHGPGDELRALAWSPDGKTLAGAGHDGRIWLWHAR